MNQRLYTFGREWGLKVKKAKPVKMGRKIVARAEAFTPRAAAVTHDEIEAARDWIRNAQPSVEEIEQRASSAPRGERAWCGPAAAGLGVPRGQALLTGNCGFAPFCDHAGLVLRCARELVPPADELGNKLIRPADLRARL